MGRQREASKLRKGSVEAPLNFNARSCSACNAALVQRSKEQSSGLTSSQQSAKRGAQNRKAAAGVGKQPQAEAKPGLPRHDEGPQGGRLRGLVTAARESRCTHPKVPTGRDWDLLAPTMKSRGVLKKFWVRSCNTRRAWCSLQSGCTHESGLPQLSPKLPPRETHHASVPAC